MNPLLIASLLLFASPSFASAQQNPAVTDSYQIPANQTTLQQTPPQTNPETVTSTNDSDFASQVEADVFADTNAAREQNGLPDLTLDPTLASIAQSHSADMLANNYFNHNDLSGCSPSCRLTNAGYSWQAMGENIYMMSGYNLDAEGTANQIVTGWMNSPDHKANMLNTSYTQTGVGIAISGSTVYATSDYAEPQTQ